MAQQPSTPVAEPETAAPAGEVEAQATPASPPPPPPQSENGPGQATTETGAEVLLAVAARIDDPDVADRLWMALKPDVREKTAAARDLRGRGEQRGRRLAANDTELRGRDEEDHAAIRGQRDDAEKALASDEDVDGPTRKRTAKALRTAAEDSRDHELKAEAFRIIKALPIYEDYGDDEVAGLQAVQGKPWGTWFAAHLNTALEVRGRAEYERGVQEGQGRLKADEKLEAVLVASEDRPGAPTRTAVGTPTGGLSLAQYVGLPSEERERMKREEPEKIDAMTRKQMGIP